MRLRLTPLLALLFGCAPPLPPAHAPTPAELTSLRQRVALDRSPEAQVALGAAWLAAGQRDSARSVLGRVLASSPRNPPALLYLGITSEEMGDYARADSLYRAYVELGRSAPLRRAVARRLSVVQRELLAASARRSLAAEAQLSRLPPSPGTIAVFPFGYSGQDARLQSLSRALAALLITDLGQTDRLRVLERTQVQVLLDEIKLSGSGLVDPATAVRGGRLLRAGRIVQGQLGGSEQALRLAAAVVRADSAGRRPAPVEVQDRLSRLFAMEKSLAFGLYRSMGIELTVAERERVSHQATENLEALLEFGWGLQAEDEGDPVRAADHFQRAARLDPRFLEARRHEANARALAAALPLTPQRLAQAGVVEIYPGVPAPPLLDGVRPGTSTLGLDPLLVALPDPIVRSPGLEMLGLDGVTIPATLIIVFGRP